MQLQVSIPDRSQLLEAHFERRPFALVFRRLGEHLEMEVRQETDACAAAQADALSLFHSLADLDEHAAVLEVLVRRVLASAVTDDNAVAAVPILLGDTALP